MWPVVKRSLVIGAVCLAGVGGTAYAEFTDVLEVKVPFPFIVGNHTLPAGSTASNARTTWAARS
jgi:hypothetical protein